MGPGLGGIRARPLGIVDTLDATFQVYRRHFVAFITVMGVVIVPSAVLSLVVVLAAGLGETSLVRNVSPEVLLGVGIVGVLAIIVLAIVASLAQLVAGGAAILLASGAILGQPIGVGEAFRTAFSRIGGLLLASIVVFLPLSLLITTCLGIPVAIYLGLGWVLVFQALLIERLGAIDAMRRSWHLVNGHRWRLLACLLLVGVIVWLLVSIPAGVFSVLGVIGAVISANSLAAILTMQIGQVALQALAQTLFGSIIYITATLLYYDLRMRKEAFDPQQGAEVATPTDAPSGWDRSPTTTTPPPSSPPATGTPPSTDAPPSSPPSSTPPAPPSIPPPPASPPDR
jgi:hypothetical protein